MRFRPAISGWSASDIGHGEVGFYLRNEKIMGGIDSIEFATDLNDDERARWWRHRYRYNFLLSLAAMFHDMFVH